MKRRLDEAGSAAGPATPPPPASAAAAAGAAAAAADTAPAPQQQHGGDAEPPGVVVRPEQYEQQLAEKLERVKGLFAAAGIALPREVEVHRSAPSHYRQRAEFRVWHEGGSCHYIMFHTPPGAKQPKRFQVDSFPVGSQLMNVLMSEVMRQVAACEELRKKLYQVNIHTTLSGEAMVTLIYHRALGDAWSAEAAALRGRLREAAEAHLRAEGQGPPAGQQQQQKPEQQQQQQQQQQQEQQQQPAGAGQGQEVGQDQQQEQEQAPEQQPSWPVLNLIGRSHKQKLVLGEDWVTERLSVGGRELAYRQVEGAFSQPNSGIAAKMLDWARRATSSSGGHDLLELYCGNGNFTVALAPCFRQVVATEVSKSSVEAARVNLEANGASNAFVARMAAHEFTETWKAKGTRNRLKGLAPWDQLDLNTLLVDPPRAGLDDESRQLLGDFDRIVYISCNPETLARDVAAAAAAGSGHAVEAFAVFDQFPYTHHVECGAYLVRRPAGGA